MSALSALRTEAARAAGTALAAGLLVAAGVAPVWALDATGARQTGAGVRTSGALVPLKSRPGASHGAHPGRITVRLPDGRLLHFSSAPSATSGSPGSGVPASGTPSGTGTGTGSPAPSGPSGRPGPSGQPSGDPSASAVPVPVVGSLFPSPVASGSPAHRRPTPSPRPSRSGSAPRPSASPQAAQGSAGPVAAARQGGDAVPPAVDPERPASTVPPPLGPQAVLPPDVHGTQLAAPRTAAVVGSSLAHRGRLLGVGLALIGTGAALFGWRIRRL